MAVLGNTTSQDLLVNGTINVMPKTGNYTEGIRIHKYSGWADIILGCNTGTLNGPPSSNGGWFIANNTANQFLINNVDSGTANASLWINTDKKVTMNGACNVVGALTQNGTAVSLNGHNHDGRYVYWGGSAANGTACTWGTLTTANGYTALSHLSSSDGGDLGIVSKGGQISMQLDGYFYQREGRARCLDTTDSSSFAAASHNHDSTYLKLAGGSLTGTMKWNATSLPNKASSPYAVVIDAFASGGEMGWRQLGSAAFTESTAYAAASHGNHVPTTQTANNAIFLRNDNTWQTVTPANIGAATSSHTHNYAGSSSAGGAANSAAYANKVYAIYTTNGGQQPPSYYGKNYAGFLMSNATVNGDSHYKNWIYIDAYDKDDVGGATAIGVDRMEAKAFIMQSDKNRTSWNNSAELLTNLSTLDATKLTGTISVSSGNAIISGTSGTNYIQLPSGIKLY